MAGCFGPEVADRLGDAGVSVFNFALDSWDLKPSLPKHWSQRKRIWNHIWRKQYVDGYLGLFNMKICRNNTEDIRKLTEYAPDHRVATRLPHQPRPRCSNRTITSSIFYDNPTYIRPEDWREVDARGGLAD